MPVVHYGFFVLIRKLLGQGGLFCYWLVYSFGKFHQ